MNIVIDLNTILTALVGAGVTWAVAGIRGINKKLSDLNGTVRELKVWKGEHTKLDDERHEKADRNLDALWNTIDSRKK